MNNTFELNRFSLVFKKMIFERYFQLFGAFVLALFASWFIYTITNDISINTFSRSTNKFDTYLLREFQMTQMQAFSIGLAIGGIYWIFVGFNYFTNKEEGYNYLTLPASYFEKWASVVALFGLFFALFCLSFRILDIAYIQYLNNHLNNVINLEAKILFFKQVKSLSFWGEENRFLAFPYFIFFNITGLMAVGTLYFNTIAHIKTIFLAICLDALFRYLNYSFAKDIFQLDIVNRLIYGEGFIVAKTYERISFPPHIEAIYTFIFCVFLPIVLWLIALVRLREKEL